MLVCPSCKRPIVVQRIARRICWRCKRPMLRHDKWVLGRDGRMRHRHCDFPQSYLSREEWAKMRKRDARRKEKT